MRKNRIVVTPVQIPYTLRNGQEATIDVFQEVYTSHWLVDCKKWIADREKRGDTKFYKIYVEEAD